MSDVLLWERLQPCKVRVISLALFHLGSAPQHCADLFFGGGLLQGFACATDMGQEVVKQRAVLICDEVGVNITVALLPLAKVVVQTVHELRRAEVRGQRKLVGHPPEGVRRNVVVAEAIVVVHNSHAVSTVDSAQSYESDQSDHCQRRDQMRTAVNFTVSTIPYYGS